MVLSLRLCIDTGVFFAQDINVLTKVSIFCLAEDKVKSILQNGQYFIFCKMKLTRMDNILSVDNFLLTKCTKYDIIIIKSEKMMD